MQNTKYIVLLVFFLFIGLHNSLQAQQVDYSIVSVPEESGIDFTQISTPSDYVCMPLVKRLQERIEWLSNHILDISIDGNNIAYLSYRNNTTNIFIK